MSITRAVAKNLCTVNEYKIVETSFAVSKEKPTLSRAKQKVVLARKLRDKYTDLARSQRREQRGKADPKRVRPADGNEGSKKKAQLFSEVLARFEKYVGQAEKKEAPKKTISKAPTKKLSKEKSPAKKVEKKKVSPKTPVANKTSSTLARRLEEAKTRKKKLKVKKKNTSMAAKSQSAKGSLRDLKMSQNRSVVINSHIKASGKRNQAKRDSK